MIVGSGAGGAVAAATLAEAGLDVIVLEAGGHFNRDTYPERPARRDRVPLPRRRPDHRRGPPPDPGPGGEDRRRHDGDQLRHLLPGPRRCSTTGATARRRLGRATSTPTSARPRRSSGSPRSTRSGWAATASWRWRARRRSAPAAARSPATPATASSAAPAPSAADRRQARHARQLPAAGRRGGGGVRAGVEARRVLVEEDAPSASPAGRAAATAAGAPYTVRARRAVIAAGGALAHPELLLRSGLGNAPRRPQPPRPPRLLGRRPL